MLTTVRHIFGRIMHSETALHSQWDKGRKNNLLFASPSIRRPTVYENIITNLPSDEFSLEQIKHIYHLRWGQETSFRDLKHTIGTANFHSKSPEYIGFEIMCRMTLYNFCTIITMEVPIKKRTGKWEYQVNLSMAIKICFEFLSDRMGPGSVNDLISRYILPIRPDRTYARQLRFQVSASFAYRFI